MDGKIDDLPSEWNTEVLTIYNDILAWQKELVGEATGDFTLLLMEIAGACKWISNVVRRAELANILGDGGTKNVQNECVQRLDILSNRIVCNMLRSCGSVAFIISEEEREAIYFESSKTEGKYVVCFDPLDGSSNIDCGVSIGTIFGIYKVKTPGKPSLSDVLRPGSEMIVAGFCHYGSSTKILLTVSPKNTVECYNYDQLIGDFVKVHADIKIKSKKIYSINEGYYSKFNPAVKEYLDLVKAPDSGFSARYIGSMAGDLMRTILYGGIFMYPEAKLRVLYECFPMAMIVENAGGAAISGTKRVLDITPNSIHERAPIILGSKDEVERIRKLYIKHDIS